jgi:hypothetical protein
MSFSYCIVDEASQITQPVCLGPLRLAEIFVLVGDHKQLAPLVRDERAAAGGMATSLFKRLADSHPEAVSQLAIQYRMHRDIMLVSNTITYEGRLECGSEKVASRRFVMPNPGELLDAEASFLDKVSGEMSDGRSSMEAEGKHWLREVMRPERAVVFVDTDKCASSIEHERRSRRNGRASGVENAVEAEIVAVIVSAMVACGAKPSSIGVISPYRAQLRLLRSRLRGLIPEGLEVATVDTYQGRDKDAIVFSAVRANTKGEVGRLLGDARRVNVALTRAKAKLVIVGSQSTLRADPTLVKLVNLVNQRSWMLRLPSGSHEWYPVYARAAAQPLVERNVCPAGSHRNPIEVDDIATGVELEATRDCMHTHKVAPTAKVIDKLTDKEWDKLFSSTDDVMPSRENVPANAESLVPEKLRGDDKDRKRVMQHEIRRRSPHQRKLPQRLTASAAVRQRALTGRSNIGPILQNIAGDAKPTLAVSEVHEITKQRSQKSQGSNSHNMKRDYNVKRRRDASMDINVASKGEKHFSRSKRARTGDDGAGKIIGGSKYVRRP